MDEESSQEIVLDFEEIEFYGFIRKHIICFLLFVFLYLISFSIIRLFKTRSDNDELYAGDEDFFVYRVSLWMCSCALAVSIGATALLPFSVLGAEVLYIYPDNFYFKWLNWSLIHSMWNYVFFLSNLSLFILLPFAYFFIESQGLSFQCRTPRPLLARVYETIIVCVLVIIVLIGIVDVVYSLILEQNSSLSFSLFYFTSLSTPLLYSFVSLFGVFVLLLSTPFGFAKMFDVFSDSLKRSASNQLSSQYDLPEPKIVPTSAEKLQTMYLLRREARLKSRNGTYSSMNGYDLYSVCSMSNRNTSDSFEYNNNVEFDRNVCKSASMLFISKIRVKPLLHRCLPIWNYFKYPLMMLCLLFLAVLSVSMVLVNTLQLLFGFKALPDYVQYVEVHSRHMFGILGALIENTVIFYIVVSSLVGIYSLPIIRSLCPKREKTSMTGIILNCGIVLQLSSALPVLARTLGITSFDLLGAYGRINWISNFSLVWSYNVLFAACSIFCLMNKFTLPVRRELIRRFSLLLKRRSNSTSSFGYEDCLDDHVKLE